MFCFTMIQEMINLIYSWHRYRSKAITVMTNGLTHSKLWQVEMALYHVIWEHAIFAFDLHHPAQTISARTISVLPVSATALIGNLLCPA